MPGVARGILETKFEFCVENNRILKFFFFFEKKDYFSLCYHRGTQGFP